MKRMVIGFLAGIVVLATAYGSTCQTPAGTNLDLTLAGLQQLTVTTSFGNGLVTETELQPTGTGVIDPFSRVQVGSTGCEAGYNTNGTLTADNPDEKQGQTGGQNWTHALNTAELTQVIVLGVAYYQFLLDINQSSNGPISLEKVQIFTAGVDNLSGNVPGNGGFTDGSPNGTLKGATLRWSMDDATHNNYITAGSDHGSGSGDMFLYVPVSVNLTADKWLYLYSEFGEHTAANDGFEEWAIRSTASFVPEPSSLLLLGTALAGTGLWWRRRLRTT